MIHEQYPEEREGRRRAETAPEHETYEPRTREPGNYPESEPGRGVGYGERQEYPRRSDYGARGYGERGYGEDYDDVSETSPEVKTVFSTSGINIIAGLWLLLAPFALEYANFETALWNSIIVGLAVGIMAIVRVVRPDEHEGVSWVNFVLGIWLLVSPFVLGLSSIEALVWNNIIVGVIVLALAATSAMATHKLNDPTSGSAAGRRMTRARRARRPGSVRY